MAQQTPEHFADWNEAMIQRFDPEQLNNHPRGAVRWVESQRMAAVLRGLDARAEHRILDVGCGAGALLSRLPGSNREGLDLSPTMVKRAGEALGPGVNITQGDAEALPYADASFDRVVASSLLSHVRRPERVVAELIRVAKPGARVVISVCHEDKVERGLRWGRALPFLGLGGDGAAAGYHVDYHLQRFSPQRLRDLVGSALKPVSDCGVPWIFPVHYVAAYVKS